MTTATKCIEPVADTRAASNRDLERIDRAIESLRKWAEWERTRYPTVGRDAGIRQVAEVLELASHTYGM